MENKKEVKMAGSLRIRGLDKSQATALEGFFRLKGLDGSAKITNLEEEGFSLMFYPTTSDQIPITPSMMIEICKFINDIKNTEGLV